MDGNIQIQAFVWQPVVIPQAKFRDLLAAFLRQAPETPDLERQGFELRTKSPMTWDDVEAFIKAVCKWAGSTGNRVRGQVLKPGKTAIETAMRDAIIENSLRDAISQLGSNQPNPVGALERMLKIRGLDVSFASKHLRFLFPKYCPTLDSILSFRLGYKPSPGGYGSFVRRCNEIADELNTAQIEIASIFRGQTDWRPSDVEAALFAWANGWQ
jgi:hypothetical protein